MLAAVTNYADPFKIVEIAVGVITFVIVISYLFKDNSVYKLLTHILLGCATAVTIKVITLSVLRPNWWEPMMEGFRSLGGGTWNPKILLALCVVPGAMWYTLYFKRFQWMSRIVFGLFIGMGAGLAFKNYLLLIVPQIVKSFRSLVVLRSGGGLDWATSLQNILFIATLVSVLVYFFFTFRREMPLIRHTRSYGRWMMMICFGTLFGFTIMSRLSYFLDRLSYVKTELIEGVFKTIF